MLRSEIARKAFEDAGLSYDVINEGDILALIRLLNKHLRNQPVGGLTTLHLSRRVVIKKKSNGGIVECYLFVNSNYFTRRECVSFNKDGFIGFCGWADSKNEKPIIDAFMEWVDATGEVKR